MRSSTAGRKPPCDLATSPSGWLITSERTLRAAKPLRMVELASFPGIAREEVEQLSGGWGLTEREFVRVVVHGGEMRVDEADTYVRFGGK